MTTVTLRPDELVWAGTAAATGGSLPTVWADDSDSAYATFNDVASTEVGFGTSSLPAGARLKTLGLRVRAKARNFYYAVKLPTGPVTTTSTFQFATGVTSAFSTISAPALAVTVGDDSAQQAAINGVSVVLGSALFGGSAGLVVAEVYLDVVYATQPAVDVTAPSGTVSDTSSPTVTWSYTPGDDGATQARYQLKVFTEAQYTAGGFNPSTTTAVYDSGEVLGADVSHVAGPLPNDTTMRAYVRAAQTINGAAHWSDWDYVGFDTDFVEPHVASVVAAGQNDQARHRIVVTRDTGGEAWETIDVERSSDNGTTWTPVRGATGVAPIGDVWIGYDYEAGNGQATVYRARATGEIAAGPWTSSSPTSWTSKRTWLKDVRNTARSRTVQVNAQPGLTYPRVATVHRPLGRRDPVVVSDVRQLPSGEVTFLTVTDTEAADLLDLLDGTVLLLQTVATERFGSRYIHILDVQEVRPADVESEPARLWRVPFVEVAAPADAGVVVAGLTWGDIDATYDTWGDLTDTGMTWGDLL